MKLVLAIILAGTSVGVWSVSEGNPAYSTTTTTTDQPSTAKVMTTDQPQDVDFEIRKHWEDYKKTFEKYYGNPVEEANRFELFKDNLKFVEEHNSNYMHTYKVGINELSDMTPVEIMQQKFGLDATKALAYTTAPVQTPITPKPSLSTTQSTYKKPSTKEVIGVTENTGSTAAEPTSTNPATTVPASSVDSNTVTPDSKYEIIPAPAGRAALAKNSYAAIEGRAASSNLTSSGSTLPTSIDWRKSGCVTPVKNQGTCGCCWAFATCGALESLFFVATKNCTSLSAQNLVDCTGPFGNSGCTSGYMGNAYNYLKHNGINTASVYPFKGVVGNCSTLHSTSPAIQLPPISGFVPVQSKNCTALLMALIKVGPISVSVCVDCPSFIYYASGIWNNAQCTLTAGATLCHAMLLVGFAQDPTTQLGYWLVKNQWGTGWGEQGYIRILLNLTDSTGGMGCICTLPSFPVLL